VKQNLTPEQVLSLKPEAQQRLREWWKPREGDMALYNEYATNPWLVEGVSVDSRRVAIVGIGVRGFSTMCAVGEMLPLLSVGRCIALLMDKGERPVIASPYAQQRDWVIQLTKGSDAHAPDLIDALFAAVKAVLEVSPDAH
jgi:hypothetical protein